jgi:hypothetical protein
MQYGLKKGMLITFLGWLPCLFGLMAALVTTNGFSFLALTPSEYGCCNGFQNLFPLSPRTHTFSLHATFSLYVYSCKLHPKLSQTVLLPQKLLVKMDGSISVF